MYFRNLSKTETLVIADIYLTPGTAPIRWTGPGPFELAPDATSEIYVRFSPEEFGTWDEVLTFETNAGQFTVPITMRAEVGFDEDGDRWSIAMGDCNDTDPTVHPWATETCNAVDDDCDGDIDEEFDQDGDGYFDAAQCPQGRDCDDTDKTANPGADKECDQTDSDCNIVDDLDDLADLQEGVCEGMTKVCPKFGAARNQNTQTSHCTKWSNTRTCTATTVMATQTFDHLRTGPRIASTMTEMVTAKSRGL